MKTVCMKRISLYRILSLAMALLTLATASNDSLAQQKTTLSPFDALKVKVQKICPVSGKPLDSMGVPIKVQIGEEQIFLCCQACTKGQVQKEHWSTIHQNFAAAQGICPVMEKPLPENPKATVVNGHIVYICCPPCSKKIEADPKQYLTKLAGYYQNAMKGSAQASQQAKSATNSLAMEGLSKEDRLRAAVQKICPVTGRNLGSMGTPFKVRVGGMEVFLCCEGCKSGTIDRGHWSEIAKHIKDAQARCPVMDKELPANAKSAVVNGQLVYVCCPPCTKKIAADPAEYLSKVNAYYTASLDKTVR